MHRELAVDTVTHYLRQEFGRMLETREVSRVRRAAGDAWNVKIVVPASSGDVPVAELSVDEVGVIEPRLQLDDVVAALRVTSAFTASIPPPQGGGVPLASLDEAFAEGLDDEGDDASVRARVQSLLVRGDKNSLELARDLMPRLLGDPERRGITLLRMAEIERRLDRKRLALDYLEAGAREFADRFDMIGLEKTAALTLELTGRDLFGASPVHQLLEQCRARLRPLASMFDAPGLFPVRDNERPTLEVQSTMRTLSPGQVLVREGEPSRAVFVIKSGVIGVLLDRPRGPARLVRCCFPGWLLGESCVLVPGDPRCTATLTAQRVSEVWQIEAEVLRTIMKSNTSLAERIAETKHIHRIDSFFSMHETMGQLDVAVRDEMIGCIARIQTFDEDTTLMDPNEIPEIAVLVARGEVAVFEGKELTTPRETIRADEFYGVRDALHRLKTPNTVVARAGSTVAIFDAERLCALVAQGSEQIGIVLERLG